MSEYPRESSPAVRRGRTDDGENFDQGKSYTGPKVTVWSYVFFLLALAGFWIGTYWFAKVFGASRPQPEVERGLEEAKMREREIKRQRL